jgi:hypothetical protein
LTTVISDGPVEEPRMGLYFPYGSPDSGGMPTKEGDIRKREPDIHHWLVYAVDFDSGAVVWKTEVNAEPPRFDRHLKNTYASETPVTDGERVYAYFGNVGVFALDLSGKKVWERRFDPKATRLGWGTAASPVLGDGKLFVVNDNEEKSFVMALDAATGRELWRVDRDEGSNWATPFIWRNEKRTELVTAGTRQVRSYDLDGKELWHFSGMNSISIPQPFSAHGLLYVTSGYIGDRIKPVFAVRPGATGDITLAADQKSNDFIARLGRLHRIAVGLQRQGLCAQRERRHLRARLGQRVRGGGDQLARGDRDVEPGDGARQPLHPHPFTPVAVDRRGEAHRRADGSVAEC